jgi:hypothetical protein
MFTLDQTTLYYYFLSDSALNGDSKSEKFVSGINGWAASIPRNAKPASSKIGASKTGASHSNPILPPLTDASTRSSANLVLTKNVTISQQAPFKVKLEDGGVSVNIIDGGLSNQDETNGIERDAAFASPPKGKTRVTSSVSHFFNLRAHGYHSALGRK